MKTKLILVVAGLVIVGGAIGLLRHVALEKERQAERGQLFWREDRLREELDQSRRNWSSAGKAVRGHAYAQAMRYYDDARSPLEAYAEAYPTNLLDGLTIRQHLESNQLVYAQAVMTELDWAFERLKEAAIRPGVVRDFVQDHNQLSGVAAKYQGALDELAAHRATLAPTWLRVILHTDDFEERIWLALEDALRARWDDAQGRKLVFGKSLSYEEGRATWRTLNIHVRHHYARYKSEPRTWDTAWRPPEIPHAQTLEFRMQAVEGERSSWDGLPKIDVWVKPPTLVSKNQSIDQRRIMTDRLLAALKKQLLTLPVFTIDVDGAVPKAGS